MLNIFHTLHQRQQARRERAERALLMGRAHTPGERADLQAIFSRDLRI